MMKLFEQLSLVLTGGDAIRPSQKAGPDDIAAEPEAFVTKPCRCFGGMCIWESPPGVPVDEPCFNMVAGLPLSGDEPEPEPDDHSDNQPDGPPWGRLHS